MNYKGAIIQKLEEVIQDNPSMSFGEVLLNITHHTVLGKDYHKASDSEFYTVLEKLVKNGIDKEEPLAEADFNNWVNSK